MTRSRIAVVGAGLAGLTAARDLARAGREVVVFDKARGVGGRTSTRRRPPHAFDHGAQYFTCRSDAFRRQVGDWEARGVAREWTAPVVRTSGGGAASPASAGGRYVGVPGMSGLAKDLARDLQVECGRRIEGIVTTSRGWRLDANGGEPHDGFDAVVVATPAPQAVALLEAVPALAEPVSRVEMQPCLAVMVTFAEPLAVEIGGAFVTEPPLAWAARDASKPGRPAGESWVLHASPEWSAQHLELPPETVVERLLEALGTALGVPVPQPDSASAHRWRFARTAKPLGRPCLWDEERGLGACGDWALGERVEDAFTSGSRLAREVLEAS